MLLFLLWTAWAVHAAVHSSARPQTPVHAHVSLIASTTGFPAGGDETTIGIRFAIDDGWRISWRNPGGSGTPPALAWSTPKTVELGELQWPVPSRIATEGIVSYGYEKSVVLPLTARLRTGAPVERGSPVTLRANVDYVICSRECMKESSAISLTLPAGGAGSDRTPDSSAIDAAMAAVPKQMSSRWSPAARISKDELAISISTGAQESAAAFFPAQNGVIDDAAASRIETTAKGIVLHVPVSPSMSKPPSTIEGVIVFPRRGAFQFRAPLSSQD